MSLRQIVSLIKGHPVGAVVIAIFCTLATVQGVWALGTTEPLLMWVLRQTGAAQVTPASVYRIVAISVGAFSFIALIVILYAVTRTVKTAENEVEPQLSRHIEFYQARSDNRPSLRELFKMADTIWMSVHAGGNLRNQLLIGHPLKKLLLLDPDGIAIDVLATVEVGEKKAEEIRQDIKLALQAAKDNGVMAKTFDGPMTSMILGNPQSGDGWAQVELYFPWSDANNRPSIWFRQQDYGVCFARLLQIFNDMWDREPRPSSTAATLRLYANEIQQTNRNMRQQAVEVEKLIHERDALKSERDDLAGRVHELRDIKKSLMRNYFALKFRCEDTPRIARLVGRLPIARIEYIGAQQQNRELADEIRDFFRKAGWVTEDPIEVPSTGRTNDSESSRIVLNFANEDFFEDLVPSINNGAIFSPETATSHLNKGLPRDVDLVVTLFPKDWWKR